MSINGHPQEYHDQRREDAAQNLQAEIDPVDQPFNPYQLEERGIYLFLKIKGVIFCIHHAV
jgi:hypothetical protein